MPIMGTRLALEALGVLLAVGLGVGWWLEHNHREQQIGMAECQAQVQAAVKVAADKNAAAALVTEGKLNAIVQNYQQSQWAAGLSAGLAQRVHDHAICPRPLPKPAPDPGAAPSASTEPSGDGGITAATQSVLDACSADAAQLSALEAAVLAQQGIRPAVR